MQYNDAFFKKNMRLIVKIQALWRGYSGRKLVNFIKQTKRVRRHRDKLAGRQQILHDG